MSLIQRWRLRRAFRKLNKSLRETAKAARLLGEAARQGAETFKALAAALNGDLSLLLPPSAVRLSDHALSPDDAERLRQAWNERLSSKQPIILKPSDAQPRWIRATFTNHSAPDTRTPASRKDGEKEREQ